MEALTDHAMAQIIAHLETLVTDLEHACHLATLYQFVLLAQEFAGAKKTRYTQAHLSRCLMLAQRMLPIRDQLVTSGGRWTPLRDVVELLHSEASRLATLYGVARPTCSQIRRTFQQAFRTAFTQTTGKPYHKYGMAWTAKERTTITTFWDEALRTALAQFQATGTVEALDQVMACLPVWADRDHERWSPTRAWREPLAKEVMAMVTAYLQICDICLAPISQLAHAAVVDAPVIDPAQVTEEVAPQYREPVERLRAQLRALPLPKDTPKAQQAAVRKQKTQLTQELQALLEAQDAEITRRLKRHANARHKLDTLVKIVQGYADTVLQKVGKASLDALPRLLWIYDYDRQGDETWRAAKRDARRLIRQVRQTSASSGVVEMS